MQNTRFNAKVFEARVTCFIERAFQAFAFAEKGAGELISQRACYTGE